MDISIPDDQLLARIHLALYGQELNRGGNIHNDQFYKELAAFANGERAAKRPSVHPATVKNWLQLNPTTPKEHGKRFLLRFITKSVGSDERQVAAPTELVGIGRMLIQTLPHREESGPSGAHALMDSAGIGLLQSILKYCLEIKRSVIADFFRDGQPSQESDFSYFLLYRYSTNHSDVLKSFLVIKKPNAKVSNHFAFNHFIWGGPSNKHVFRECEGIILRFEKSYYLVGYNFVVKANKRSYPARYAALRDDAKKTPNGMGILSVEYGDLDASPSLFSGLTITLGAGHQPVMGRMALLHLGTFSGLGQHVFDSDVEPNEVQPKQIARDLESTIKRVAEKGVAHFGAEISGVHVNGKIDRTRVAELTQRILTMIDNVPAWESRKGSRGQARGAIESYGPGRPRD